MTNIGGQLVTGFMLWLAMAVNTSAQNENWHILKADQVFTIQNKRQVTYRVIPPSGATLLIDISDVNLLITEKLRLNKRIGPRDVESGGRNGLFNPTATSGSPCCHAVASPSASRISIIG